MKFLVKPARAVVLLGSLLLVAAPADAGDKGRDLPSERVLPLEIAKEAAAAALAQCSEDGYRVSVAVVDRAGVLKALQRADGAGPHTVDSSRRKAYTAASLREPTQKMAELMAKRPSIQELGKMNRSILILGGGLPVRIQGHVLGGIGVGGAPGAKLDEACARAGLKAIRAHPYTEEG